MSTNKSAPQSPHSHRHLIRSTSIIASGTFSSRVLGFVRDIVVARLLGTGFKADAFFVAFRIPNLLRDIAGEGAANAAVVPVLAEYVQKNDKKELGRFLSVIFRWVIIILSALTVLGMIFTPLIVRLMAPGFAAEAQKLELTVALTRIIFPYLILIGLTAYTMAVLYTYKSFIEPAYSPCLFNIAIIGSLLLSYVLPIDPVYLMAIGVLVGGVVALMFQMNGMRKIGVQFIPVDSLKHAGAQKVGRLLMPRLIGSGVYELNVFVDTLCASLSHIVGPGGVSAIYYANRLIQFPMGIFGLALASAALPTMAHLATQKDFEQLKKTLRFALESILFIMLPMMVMMMLFATPIVRILFQRGEFTAYSTAITASVLFYMSIGLASFGGVKIMVTAFHATQDTKTPVKVASICLFINVVLNLLLMGPMKVGGIALASAISSTVNLLSLVYLMEKKLNGIWDHSRDYMIRITVAALVAGAVSFLLWNAAVAFPEIIRLGCAAAAGFLVYGVCCYFFGIEQVRKVAAWSARRRDQA